MEPKAAIVFGWGAVERLAKQWHADAVVEEIEPRLWRVSVNGSPIGMIGKEPWTKAEVQRRNEAVLYTDDEES